MTEHDYSPEAYQHYLDKMHSISKWAEDTEHYRPEYKNAAALIEGEQNRGRSSPPSRERSRRRAPPPPPLPLPPIGHDYGMHPAYPSPAASFDPDFAYAHGLGSPGPMPPYYPGATQISLISPPISPMGPMPSYRPSHYEHRHHHSSSRHSSRRGRSRSRGPSRSSSISYGPGSSVMYAPPVSAPPYGSGYYVAAPPTRHSHHSHYQGPVIYV